MDNIMTFFAFSNMVVFHQKQITYSLATMSTEENNLSKPSAYYWLTKSNIQKTFSFFAAITNVLLLIEYMDFTTNVSTRLLFYLHFCVIKFHEFLEKIKFSILTLFLSQTTIQCQTMENLYRMFQLPSNRRHH